MSSSGPVSLRARFERFPATVKGAFIIRGEDPDPHQVLVGAARAVSVDRRVTRAIPMGVASLDVAPKRDIFVPFELGVSDLDPGWYDLECELDVDGTPGTFSGGKRFAVAWPRATVRRGQIRVGKEVRLEGGPRVRVEAIDCGGDSIKIGIEVKPPGPMTVGLAADGQRLEVLEIDLDEELGRGKVVAYPLMRAHRSLRIELRAHRRAPEASIEVRLP